MTCHLNENVDVIIENDESRTSRGLRGITNNVTFIGHTKQPGTITLDDDGMTPLRVYIIAMNESTC